MLLNLIIVRAPPMEIALRAVDVFPAPERFDDTTQRVASMDGNIMSVYAIPFEYPSYLFVRM